MKDFILSVLALIAIYLVIVAFSITIGFGLSVGWYTGERIITVNDNMAIMNLVMNGRG